MWYIIQANLKINSQEKRQLARPAHLKRLEELHKDNRLLVAGPCPAIDYSDPKEAGYTDSIIIAEFHSLAEAQTWAQADPYNQAGIYQSISIKPFVKVLP